MENLIRKLALLTLMTMIFPCNVLAAETVYSVPEAVVSVKPCKAIDFRINVKTNKNVYHNKDVLRLAVNLLNNRPQPVFIGICPIEAVPGELREGEVEGIFEGFLDGINVEVESIPYPPRIIGYATLTRLGPSPFPYPVPSIEEDPTLQPVPKKFRLPLFGKPSVPGHSTRIISTANILLRCPLLEAEAEPLPLEAETIEVIPAIGHYLALRPGYYLLSCHIEKICSQKSAQAQKIIQIKRRVLNAIKPEPK